MPLFLTPSPTYNSNVLVLRSRCGMSYRGVSHMNHMLLYPQERNVVCLLQARPRAQRSMLAHISLIVITGGNDFMTILRIRKKEAPSTLPKVTQLVNSNSDMSGFFHRATS